MPHWCMLPGTSLSGFFLGLLLLHTQGFRVSKPRLAFFDGDGKLHVAAKDEGNNTDNWADEWKDAGGCVGLTLTSRSQS